MRPARLVFPALVVLCLASPGIARASITAAAIAAAHSASNAASSSGAAAQIQSLPRYAELQRDVDFWIRVYSEITTLQGFLHDERNLAIVYATLDVPVADGTSARRETINRQRERWASALRIAADALEQGLETNAVDARQVMAWWGTEASPARLRRAAEEIRFQLGQADRFREGLVRSGIWESHIARTFAQLGLPPELAALPHVESSFNPAAYSKVGAAGLWQFMRSTGRLYMRVDDVVDERMDPFRATEAAARLLADNHAALGSWPLAITAYNHGRAGMRRAREAMGTDDFAVIARQYQSRSFGFASRNFYPSFLAALTIDQNPLRYFGDLERAPELRFHEIEMPGYAAIDTLERVLELPRTTLRELNPGLRPAVWSGLRMVPRGYRLRVPPERALTAAQLADRIGGALLAGQSPTRTHLVRSGETLIGLARRYGVPRVVLAELNGLSPFDQLQIGQRLRLPQPGTALPASPAAE